MKQVTLGDGMKITLFEPPDSFDPLTARPEELVRHGFPSRHDGSNGREDSSFQTPTHDTGFRQGKRECFGLGYCCCTSPESV